MRGKRFVGALTFCLVLSSASSLLLPQSSAAGGVRYRDEVFDEFTVTHDIAYGQATDEYGQPETLLLDLYEPAGDLEDARPAFVWIHGGGFISGDKATELEVDMASRFAKRGWVSVSINYRLREWSDLPELAQAILDAQHDAQAAVRWLRAHAAEHRIDPERIAVAGFSAGAVTALQTAYNSSDPGESGNPGYPSDTSACVDISGWLDTTLMDAGEPPVLVVHGTADLIPFSAAQDIVVRAAALDIPFEFHPLVGVGHNVWAPYGPEIVEWMGDFLYRYVMDAPPVGGLADTPDVATLPARTGTRWRPAADITVTALAAGSALLAAHRSQRQRREAVRTAVVR